VHHQAHESIDEIFPSSRLASQATLEESAIDLRQCHNGAFVLEKGPAPKLGAIAEDCEMNSETVNTYDFM
jgi:hypothetical protein